MAAGPARQRQPLLDGPVLATLVGLAAPNVLALASQSLAAIAETGYIGRLGTEPLAAMALVFPTIALTMMLSTGAIGGGVSSAISRALGGNDRARAETLALHALVIGGAAGSLLSALFLAFGREFYGLLGGRGSVLEAAVAYSRAFFTGALAIWIFNSLISIARGTGNMRLPSTMIIMVSGLQIALGAVLSMGLGPLPALGLPGVAVGQILAYALGALLLLWGMTRPGARLRLGTTRLRIVPEMLRDILKVGAVACLSPIQSILVVVLLARLASGFGTEALAGFGIGIRLELLLVPIAFAIGVACVPMVGMAIGAGDIARARRVAWTGALLSASLVGAIGLVFGIHPHLWAGLFTSASGVLESVAIYLSIAGIGFPAYGMGLCLYFAAQGSGRIVGPVLGGTIRLAVVALGGWWLLSPESSFEALAWLVVAAMLAYGLSTALFVLLTRWRKN